MPSDQTIKRLLWAYFFLLIIEGALRKWVVPSLSAPLLVVRDPIAIMIYLIAMSRGAAIRGSQFIGWTLFLAVSSFVLSLGNRGTLIVTAYGIHANFLHLPLIFIIPAVFDLRDVRQMGLVFLLFIPLMTFLAVMQFRTGTNSIWNVGAGGNLGGQLTTAQNKIRASGTFSFVNGLVSYLGVCAAYLIYHFMQRKVYPRWLGWISIGGLLLILGICGSRSAVVLVSVVCGAVVWICIRQPQRFGKALRPVIMGTLAVFALLFFLPIFSEGIRVQQARFEGGGGIKEGLLMRYFGEFPEAVNVAFSVPLFGFGLGMGTNVGAQILTGERQFLLSEGEWGRVVMESGPILGFAYIALRIGIAVYIFSAASQALSRGNILPTLLCAAAVLDVVSGQFGQPTALGFAVLTAGLSLAATKVPEEEIVENTAIEAPGAHAASSSPMRGRSRYAEQLNPPGKA